MSTANYIIASAAPEQADTWDQDARQLDGTIFHTSAWRRILDPDGSKSDYFRIIHRDTGNVTLMAGFMTERYHRCLRLSPLPGADNQSILMAGNSPGATLLRHLVSLGIHTAHSRQAAWLRLVFKHPKPPDQICNRYLTAFPATVGTMVLNLLSCPPGHLWNHVFNKQGCQQKFISRFEKDGFSIRQATSPADRAMFYQYYAQNLKADGGEPFPQDHFDRLQAELPAGAVRITLLERDAEIAGGLLMLLDHHRNTAYLRYLALNRSVPNHYHPPCALYWEAIEYAARKGFASVDFGLTANNRNDPEFRLKKRFGCEFRPQPAVIIPATSAAIIPGTQHLLEPSNSHYGLKPCGKQAEA